MLAAPAACFIVGGHSSSSNSSSKMPTTDARYCLLYLSLLPLAVAIKHLLAAFKLLLQHLLLAVSQLATIFSLTVCLLDEQKVDLELKKSQYIQLLLLLLLWLLCCNHHNNLLLPSAVQVEAALQVCSSSSSWPLAPRARHLPPSTLAQCVSCLSVFT